MSPPTVEVTRATVIATDALPEDGAAAWLDAAVRDSEATSARRSRSQPHDHGHRLAAMDAYVSEVSAGQALATASATAPASRSPRATGRPARAAGAEAVPLAAPAPAAAAGRVLGRDVALACEVLALRARVDLDQGRGREAALQLRAALDAALAELEGWRATDAVARRHNELPGTGTPSTGGRGGAKGGFQPEQTETLEAALGRLEATCARDSERVAHERWAARATLVV